MLLRFLIISCIGIISWQEAFTQSIAVLKDEADLFFSVGRYNDALNNYLKVQKEKPNKLDIKYKLGLCYMELGNIQNAEQYLLFVANQKGSDIESWFYLGRLNHLKGQFQKAITYYKRYIKLADVEIRKRKEAKHYIRQCAAAREIKYYDEQAIVENLGVVINGPYDDYAPIMSPGRENTIYFSSIRQGNAGGLRDQEGLEDDYLGTYNSDIYSSQLVNGEWTSIRPFDNLINSSRHDEIVGFSDDATVLYYYKGYHPIRDGAIFTDTIRASEEVVFPNEFKSPVKLKRGDQTPFFFNDSIIIFSAKREKGYGGLDLYVIQKLNGGFWTRPQNLGPEINTPYDEKCPFLTKNGRTLFFSSNSNKSMGGFDIFKTTFVDQAQEWSEPQNLGMPVNSPGDDLSFSVSQDGLKTYFTSNRMGGLGGFDIYAGYFKTVQSGQLSLSNPVSFHLVKDGMSTVATPIHSNTNSTSSHSTSSSSSSDPSDMAKEKVKLKHIFYEGDNVITPANINELNKIAELAVKYPQMKVEVSGHTDDTDPEKFRLYFSYLRAEKAAKFLQQNGMLEENIVIKGYGSVYPLAKNKSLDGSPSKMGKKLNKRIEFRFLNLESVPVDLVIEKPDVNDRIKEYKRSFYESSLKGLSYKVQVAAMKNMYDSNIIVKYNDPMVEKDPKKNILRYTVGLFRTYSSAQRLRDELRKAGVTRAYIVPFIDGVRMDVTQAEVHAEKYYDLRNYIIGN